MGIETTNDSGSAPDTPPDLTPPADAAPASYSAPAPAAPSIDYNQLAQANAQYLAPVLQQFAPKPPPPAHEAPDYFAIPPGLDGSQAARWVQERVQSVADARADAKVKAAMSDLENRFGAALRGQAGYFQAQFASDPNFVAIKPHFEKYVQAGYNPQDARYLAERDSGRHAAAPTPGAPTTRTISAPPPHLTTPSGRAGASTPTNGFDPVRFKTDENYRQERFKMHAANAGVNLD